MDAPHGAVKVTALIVGGVVAEAVTTLLAAVVTTVPHTARATAARRVRPVGIGRHLSLVGVEVGQGSDTRCYPGSVTPFRTMSEAEVQSIRLLGIQPGEEGAARARRRCSGFGLAGALSVRCATVRVSARSPWSCARPFHVAPDSASATTARSVFAPCAPQPAGPVGDSTGPRRSGRAGLRAAPRTARKVARQTTKM